MFILFISLIYLQLNPSRVYSKEMEMTYSVDSEEAFIKYIDDRIILNVEHEFELIEKDTIIQYALKNKKIAEKLFNVEFDSANAEIILEVIETGVSQVHICV